MTRCLVSSVIAPRPLSAWETVAVDTPATAATSLIPTLFTTWQPSLCLRWWRRFPPYQGHLRRLCCSRGLDGVATWHIGPQLLAHDERVDAARLVVLAPGADNFEAKRLVKPD